VATPAIAAALRARGLEGEEADRLARLARGSVGWAMRAVDQPKLAASRQEMIERLVQVPGMGLASRLDLAESLTSERKDRSAVRRSLELLLLLGRDLLLVHEGLEPELAVNGQREILRSQAESLSLAEIHRYLQRIRLAMDRIDANVDPRLALEAMLVGER
jgi:hypothetical protein